MQKKVTQHKLGELSFGVVGPLNYFKRGPQSPKAQSPKSKGQNPKAQRAKGTTTTEAQSSRTTIERATDHAHGLGSPVADTPTLDMPMYK